MDKTTPMKAKPLVNVTCKLGEKGCFEDGRCHALGRCENKIETNADRIRSMSDEELADYIFGVSVGNAPCVLCSEECDFCELTDEECKEKTLKWLQSEVKGSE